MAKERKKNLIIIVLSIIAVIGWFIALYDFDPYDEASLLHHSYQDVVNRHGEFYAEGAKNKDGSYICAIKRSDDFPYCLDIHDTFTYVYFNSENKVCEVRTSTEPLNQAMTVEKINDKTDN